MRAAPSALWSAWVAATGGSPMSEADEERHLRLWRETGRQSHRDAVVVAHIPLVVRQARRYGWTGLPLEDIESEMMAAMVVCVDGFDPSRGARFSTYAHFHLRNAGKLLALEGSAIVRVPGRNNCGLADRLKLGGVRVPTGEGPNGEPCILGRLADPTDMHADLVEAEEAAGMREAVRGAVAELGPRMKMILERTILAPEGERETLNEVGLSLGISRERVRQIQVKAMEKMKASLRREKASTRELIAGRIPAARASLRSPL